MRNRRVARPLPPANGDPALSATEPLAAWAKRKVRLDGKPFSFEGHEYLRGIYDDTSPHVVVIKAAQIGGTTWAILRSIHACTQGLNTIYYFPTKTDVIEFSKARAGPLIEGNEALDDSRAAMRGKLVCLPRTEPIVELFARHMAADAKKLEEDPESGSCNYRYFKTGENHFSMAFTYAWLASQYRPAGFGVFELYRQAARKLPKPR